MRIHRVSSLVVLLLLLVLTARTVHAAPDPNATAGHSAQASANTYVLLNVAIDRSNVPPLTYNDLTLVIEVGQVSDLFVSSHDQPVPYTYNPATGKVVVTTGNNRLRLLLVNPAGNENLGAVAKAPLQGDRRWAWSHALDDNTGLNPSIEILQAKGWRGTLFMIGKWLHDTRQESWIVDAPQLKRLLGEGWSVGSHTWDHSCTAPQIADPAFIQQTIVQGYERLKEIVASSPVPDYRIMAFASPCARQEYQPALQALIAGATTDILFEESGAQYLMVVDSGAAPYSIAGHVAHPFSFGNAIGRDGSMGKGAAGADAVQATIDWMAAHTAADRHFWYNTVSHAGDEAALAAVVDYAYQTYGPGGSDELWMAPSDEIYSYLLVRDLSTVTASDPIPLQLDYHMRTAGMPAP